ncbi:DUF1844 domain-containing protein [Candidatus Bathyarchaeota archaeon]|nr:DUF1844 domain-containing protein [Candidatus Bathyarchaeota archaeon]
MESESAGDEKAAGAVDITSIDIYPLLGFFISLLNEQAWQYMGLRVRPATQKIEKDVSRARIAIDCIAFLIDKLEPQLSEQEKTKMRALLTNLQINFVHQQG